MHHSLLKFLLVLFLSFSITGCRSCHFNYCVEGADAFVIDSYKIRQGKLAILEMEGKEVPPLDCDAMLEYEDVITEDDILNIAVYHPTRRDLMEAIAYINNTIGFRVINGCIDIPDLPPVLVNCLTLEEARTKLQEKYREQIRDVEVFITYRDRLARKVELAGHVKVPSIPVDGKLRLFDALSRAQVPNNVNFFMSYVVRDGCPLPIDMHKLVQEGDMCQNIVLRGGDKIYIADPIEARAMVMGEVLRPMPVPLPSGYISLREALVTAGGIPVTRGDRDCIQVIRGGLVNPKIYVLSWEHIVHLPNDSLLLMPGDIVYVGTRPIAQWNDFMSQLMPSFANVATVYGAYTLFNN
jgi:polysaccharide export outer membrane protein